MTALWSGALYTYGFTLNRSAATSSSPTLTCREAKTQINQHLRMLPQELDCCAAVTGHMLAFTCRQPKQYERCFSNS